MARDASPRTADLPLNVRVLELVRGMTEQAARVALDTALRPVRRRRARCPSDLPEGRGRGPDGEGPPPTATARGAGGGAPCWRKAAAAARERPWRTSRPRVSGAGLAPSRRPALAGRGVRGSGGGSRAGIGAGRGARAAPRFGDQVTLHFSGEDGLEGRLRVAVRGQNVRATILSDDPGAAERFSRGLGDLQRALLERGFSEARLNVQHTARSEGPASGNAPREDAREDRIRAAKAATAPVVAPGARVRLHRRTSAPAPVAPADRKVGRA